MTIYKRTDVYEAVQFNGSNIVEVLDFTGKQLVEATCQAMNVPHSYTLRIAWHIKKHDQTETAPLLNEQWLVRNKSTGRLHVYPDDIFQQKFKEE